MAFTKQNKRVGYDNIAVGSTTGAERIVANDTGGDEGETTVAGLYERKVTSDTGTLTSVQTQAERLVPGVTDMTSVFLEVI